MLRQDGVSAPRVGAIRVARDIRNASAGEVGWAEPGDTLRVVERLDGEGLPAAHLVWKDVVQWGKQKHVTEDVGESWGYR
ncbi:hypothetical protein E4U53_001497, partial [Claviceps sorghi]